MDFLNRISSFYLNFRQKNRIFVRQYHEKDRKRVWKFGIYFLFSDYFTYSYIYYAYSVRVWVCINEQTHQHTFCVAKLAYIAYRHTVWNSTNKTNRTFQMFLIANRTLWIKCYCNTYVMHISIYVCVCMYIVTSRWLMSRMVYAISRHFTHLICVCEWVSVMLNLDWCIIILYIRFTIYTNAYVHRGWKSLYTLSCATQYFIFSLFFSLDQQWWWWLK